MTPKLTKFVGAKNWLIEGHAACLPMPAHGAAVALPFLGAGSVAAFYRGRGCRVTASDLNSRLVNAHQAVQQNVSDVIGRLCGIENAWRAVVKPLPEGKEQDVEGRIFFERVRDRVDEGPPPAQAASLLFIIRAGFNGLLRENVAGAITTAYGKPKLHRDLVAAEELRAYAAAIQGVEFLHEDFAVTCGRARGGWASYLDSPYQGTFVGYCGGDWEAAQETLPGVAPVNDRRRLTAMLDYLDAVGVRFALSDSDSTVTRSLYRRWNINVLSRRGTINSDGEDRGDVPELLVSNGRPR